MLALIDGDVLLYACGFASDAGAKANGQVHEDLAFCLHGVNETIKSILKNSGCETYQVFLSSPVNSRAEVYPEYKANRDELHKPHWYKEIRTHLLDRHYAVFSDEGDEADDALGIAQCSGIYGPTVICSIDKDLDMIPGLHYNFSKTKKALGVYDIDPVESLRIFYRQMLKGDSVDNIPGLFRHKGIKCTQKILAPLDAMTDERDMYQHVLEHYEGDEAHLALIGKLLWIKRDEQDWQAPLPIPEMT